MFQYDRVFENTVEERWKNREDYDKAKKEILDILYKYQISLVNVRWLFHDALLYIEEEKIIRRD